MYVGRQHLDSASAAVFCTSPFKLMSYIFLGEDILLCLKYNNNIYTHTHTHIYIYIYIYTVCVCVYIYILSQAQQCFIALLATNAIKHCCV